MKTSKNYIVIFALLIVAGLFTKACGDEFINRPSQGSLSEDVLADANGVNTLLIGAYASLSQTGPGGWGDGIHGGGPWEVDPSNWIYGSVMGTEAHKGSDAGDQIVINTLGSFNTTASNTFINGKWRAVYEGINRANAVLSVLKDVPEDEISATESAQIEAEARFIRGHFYFELRRFFKNVPYIDEETDALTPQPNDQEIWPRIEADFQFAYDNLPETQSAIGRANSWAAAAYLGKTYLYQQKFSEAKGMFDAVIANGVTADGQPYALVPLDQVHNPIFGNNAGRIFSIQASADDGTGTINNANPGMMLNYPYNSPFRCCGFYQPTQYLVNAHKTVDGLPQLDNFLDSNVSNDLGVPSNQPFEVDDVPVDPRLDYTAGRRGVPFHDWGPHPGQRWVRDQAYSGPYASKKHIWWQKDDSAVNNPNSWAPGSSYKVPIIRFADVLLMAAEAEIEVGSLGTALEYINRVRSRAANPSEWVSNDYNRGYAFAIVGSEAEMLGLDPAPTEGQWVVREDTGTTFTYLGGGVTSVANWNEYEIPNYEIAEYTTLGSQDQARKIVRHERLIELALEGHRFFDLVRWGIAEQTINNFMDFEEALVPSSYLRDGRFTGGKNEYFPIPQRQLDLSVTGGEAVMTQNPGY